MVFYRTQSQFFRHVVTPFFYYLGIAFLCCLLMFAYYLLKNALKGPPRSLHAVEFGTEPGNKPIAFPLNKTTVPAMRPPPGEPEEEKSGPILPAEADLIATPPAPGPAQVNKIQAQTPQVPAGTPTESKQALQGATKPPQPSKPRKGRADRGEPGEDSYYVIQEQLNTTVKINKTAYKSRACSAITGRRILMNYAHNCCKMSQPLNCESGLKNGFDICIQFTQASVDPWFVEHNKKVFEAGVMAGYGVWKSYLIMRVLMTLDDDDVLFYSDSGAVWLGSPEDYFCLMDERGQDVVVFSVGLPEDEYTKGDAFLVSGCTSDDCINTQQRLGGYSMYRKSMLAFNFLSTWLTFNQDLRIVSDERSTLRKDEPKFKANRHDQTALSLSSKRCGIPEWPDPSQWGANGYNKMLREKPEFKKIAKTIIDCTRNKS